MNQSLTIIGNDFDRVAHDISRQSCRELQKVAQSRVMSRATVATFGSRIGHFVHYSNSLTTGTKDFAYLQAWFEPEEGFPRRSCRLKCLVIGCVHGARMLSSSAEAFNLSFSQESLTLEQWKVLRDNMDGEVEFAIKQAT